MNSSKTTVAVLGTGLMGAAMARSLLRADMDVRVWNRTRAKADPLADDGAHVATDAASAVADADVVITMLFDADAVGEVMAEVLPVMPDRAVWVQASTVGLDSTEELVARARDAGRKFVDAPVLGTRQPAEEGKLIVLAAGPESVREQVQPVLDAIGSRTVWVSERAGDGHRLKLVANSWVLSLTAATGQAVALARGSGLDPASFLDVISGGPTDCAYARTKGEAMIAGDFAPAFTLAGAAKDAALIAEAMDAAGVDATVVKAIHHEFERAEKAGHGAEDMAAVVHAFAGAETPHGERR
jgi:3-hydroxyisobutyrate dehydrogenase